MSVIAEAHRLRRLSAEHAGWTLLRMDLAAPVLAMLGRHFDRATRRLPAPELFSRLDSDLLDLRENGFDLPRTAQAYCADWVRAGILLRRADETAREETLEPSEKTFAALAFVSGLEDQTSTITESRLTTLSTQLSALSRDSDPSAATRLQALHAERAAIDAQIAAVESGDFPVLDDVRAAERAREILALAAEIPGDFARVRADLEALNRSLRAALLEESHESAEALSDVFRGVDLIGQSDAGRSFNAFYDMILDPERGALVDGWIDTVLARPFARGLTADQRRGLRRLLSDIEETGAEVHATMTGLSRSLRHFVQSRHFETQRRMQRLLRQTQQKAVRVAASTRPQDTLDLVLTRVGMSIESIAALRLHNPSDDVVAESVEPISAETIDLDALRTLVRASEIDMDELTRNIAEVLRRDGQASIGSVLTAYPATQGLASVVGLVVLAFEHGAAVGGAERVEWTSTAGVDRIATVGRRFFDATDPLFADLPRIDEVIR